jgi:hypothetical protein
MEVRVHIDRLIVDGPAMGRAERNRLAAALSTELGRLITENGLPPMLAGGLAVPAAPGGPVSGSAADPGAYGRALAGAVYAGLGNAP